LEGQYEIWKYLHKRFPKLMMEDCDTDYGLARMATSIGRQATQKCGGCSPQRDRRQLRLSCGALWSLLPGRRGRERPAALDAVIRSRMIVGTLTFATYTGRLSERVSLFPAELKTALKRNILVFKQYRHSCARMSITSAVFHKAQEWDAIEFCKRDGSEAVVLASAARP